MIKEELEKMFDEKFDLGRIDAYENGLAIGYVNQNEEVKQFIFNEIIPQVLKSVIYECNYYEDVEILKQQAKEKYGITL